MKPLPENLENRFTKKIDIRYHAGPGRYECVCWTLFAVLVPLTATPSCRRTARLLGATRSPVTPGSPFSPRLPGTTEDFDLTTPDYPVVIITRGPYSLGTLLSSTRDDKVSVLSFTTLRTIMIVLPPLTFRTYQILPHTNSYFHCLYS